MNAVTILPQYVLDNYEAHEWRHATAILYQDFPDELADITSVLSDFRLAKSEVELPGGNKSVITKGLETAFSADRGWARRPLMMPGDIETHEVDCYKNRVALEIEWNSKDSVFVRDLNNFRVLFDSGRISVGVIVTRCDELQQIFNCLVDPNDCSQTLGRKYGESTTHMSKLLPRLETGGGGGCPILVFGIRKSLYRPDL